MQKSILISIQPQHVFNILTGKKTLELRKSVPKDFKGWVYIYCTKSKPYLHMTQHDILEKYPNTEDFILNDDPMITGFDILNGQVVARFWFDEYEKLPFVKSTQGSYYECNFTHIEKSCMQNELLEKYGKGKDLYAWHIKKLEVFDKPMEISEFYSFGSQDHHDFITTSKMIEDEERKYFIKSYQVRKAPQSWMFVYTNEQLP